MTGLEKKVAKIMVLNGLFIFLGKYVFPAIIVLNFVLYLFKDFAFNWYFVGGFVLSWAIVLGCLIYMYLIVKNADIDDLTPPNPSKYPSKSKFQKRLDDAMKKAEDERNQHLN